MFFYYLSFCDVHIVRDVRPDVLRTKSEEVGTFDGTWDRRVLSEGLLVPRKRGFFVTVASSHLYLIVKHVFFCHQCCPRPSIA